MELDEYTPDNICRAMGLPSFADDPRLHQHEDALRVLLAPPFHPEVCITCWATEEGITLHVVALQVQYWDKPKYWKKLPYTVTVIQLPKTRFAGLIQEFALAEVDDGTAELYVSGIDGVSVATVRQSSGGSQVLKPNLNQFEAVKRFLGHIFKPALETVNDVYFRYVFAEAGRGLGLRCSVELPFPAPLNLLILGTPEDRADYFASLHRAAERTDLP